MKSIKTNRNFSKSIDICQIDSKTTGNTQPRSHNKQRNHRVNDGQQSTQQASVDLCPAREDGDGLVVVVVVVVAVVAVVAVGTVVVVVVVIIIAELTSGSKTKH